MNNWQPLEIVAMVAVLVVAAGILGALAAWYQVRVRQLERAAFTSDDQAARALGASLAAGELGHVDVQEVMAAFAQMDSAKKRSLASAVAGLVAATDPHQQHTLPQRIRATARAFAEADCASNDNESVVGEAHARGRDDRFAAEERQRGQPT